MPTIVRKIEAQDPVSHFELIVQRAFVAEYRAMGIDWSISTMCDGAEEFVVEKRQELNAVNNCDAKDVLQRSAAIKNRVEKRLEFPSINALINRECFRGEVGKIVLARDARFSPADYAIWNNCVVTLATRGWFIALAMPTGEWNTTMRSVTLPVRTTYGDFFFTDHDAFAYPQAVGKMFDNVAKWWLFPARVGNMCGVKENLKSKMSNMLQENLHILCRNDASNAVGDSFFGTMEEELAQLRDAS